MTAATITIVLLLVALIVMYKLETERDSLGLYVFALVLLVLVGTAMTLGLEISSVFTVKYKKKPMMHVECNGSKCDTTYIYKFNQ